MTKLTAPPSFEKFGDNFKDIENKYAGFEYLLDKALSALNASEKSELARFLEGCIASDLSDEKLQLMWMRTGPFLAFEPMRVFFRGALDELQRDAK